MPASFEKNEETGQYEVNFEKEAKDQAPKVLDKFSATPKQPSLESRLVEFFGKANETDDGFFYYDGIAGLVSLAHQGDGMLIAAHGPNMAKAWSDLADESPKVRQVLEMLMTGGAWGGVLMAMTPVVMGIMANHGILTRDFLGMNKEEDSTSGIQEPERDAPSGEQEVREPIVGEAGPAGRVV